MTYLIGEIGQNHNGSVDVAKLIIDYAAMEVIDSEFDIKLKPMDAVKFTIRDLDNELSKSAMNKPYISEHSFGKTYGEHRRFLELSFEEHLELYKYAKSKELDFIETLCSIECIKVLDFFQPDYLKVASRDLSNIPLLSALASTKIPIIISTGMTGKKELDDAIETITQVHEEITILHCVSEYPTNYENINLNAIRFLKEHYSQYRVGYSDHSVGISMPVAAVALGAEVIEKHITLDRKMKGTDQKGSLAIDGIYRFKRDLRLLEIAMGEKNIARSSATDDSRLKLERSLASKRKMKKGEVVTENDIKLLSPGDGFKWSEKGEILGRKLLKDLDDNEIFYDHFLSK